MRRIFLLRHGDYDMDNKNLNAVGITQAREAGERIRSIVDGDSVYISSSPVQRVYQTAQIVAERLGTGEIEQVHFLSDDGSNQYNPNDFPKMMKVVEERRGRASNLVIVTHMPIVKYFTPHLAETEGLYLEEVPEIVGNGKGYCLDFKERKSFSIP